MSGQLFANNRWRKAATLLIAVFLILLFLLTSCTKKAEEKPLFRFDQWTDTHMDVMSGVYKQTKTKLQYLVDAANGLKGLPPADFVVATGDLIHAPTPLQRPLDMGAFLNVIAGLKCAFIPVIGNHEDDQVEADPSKVWAYRGAFGPSRENYTFDAGGIRFIAFDDSGAPGSNDTPQGQARRAWLASVLSQSATQPKILLCHVPLLPVRDEQVLSQSFGYPSSSVHDEQLLKILDQYQDSIVAVLSGHLHMHGTAKRGKILQIVSSGTAGYPAEFMRYEVFPRHIRVTSHELPPELQFRQTDFHGKPMKPTDFVDALHKTHEAYVKGLPGERNFDIPLPVGLGPSADAPAPEEQPR